MSENNIWLAVSAVQAVIIAGGCFIIYHLIKHPRQDLPERSADGRYVHKKDEETKKDNG